MTDQTRDPRATRPKDLLERWRASESGTISIELAFVFLLLIPLSLGIYDFGRYGMAHSRVTSAARAGTQYGMQDFSTAADIAGMVAAARADADDTSGALDVTASRFCRCPGVTAETDCSTICTDGSYAPLHISVTVEEVHELLFTYPGLDQSIAVGATSDLRIR